MASELAVAIAHLVRQLRDVRRGGGAVCGYGGWLCAGAGMTGMGALVYSVSAWYAGLVSQGVVMLALNEIMELI